MSFIYNTLRVEKAGSLSTIIIDNPPINILTMDLFSELVHAFEEIAAAKDLKVVVVKSKNPDFFLAHLDVGLLQALSEGTVEDAVVTHTTYHELLKNIREMDKIVIGQIEGRIGGGGAELAMNFDMRFGVKGKTVFNQMEVPLGILPGGSGTQMLPRLIGRGRAMEIILGAMDIDSDTADRWGLLNRIFDENEIDGWVEGFANRIASFPAEALIKAKQAINSADKPIDAGLQDEAAFFAELLFSDSAKKQMKKFMAAGGQTSKVELQVASLSQEICSSNFSKLSRKIDL